MLLSIVKLLAGCASICISIDCLAISVKLDKLEGKVKLTNITNLSIDDEEFMYNVTADIEHFINQRHSSSVLLFPPVNNFRRFLIHQACEQFRQQYHLFTFSVGKGPFRRTVVCFRNQLLDPNKFKDSTAAANFESRKKSPVKNWRSERKTDGITNDITSVARHHKSTIGKMGVEKNGSETRLFKTNSLDLYRPPALRNYDQSGASPDAIAATYTLTAAAAERSFTTTVSDKATVLSTSISCNNSPIHANENSFDNNTITSRCVNDGDSTTKATTTSTSVIKSEAPISSGDMPTAPATIAAVSSNFAQQRQSSAVRRERRPDRAVYIPRARRSQTTPPTTPAATLVEVTGLQQQQHNKTNAIAPSAASLAPTLSTTACNNNSNNSCDGSNQQRLAITSETRASVHTTASTKSDDISGNKSTGIEVVCTGKKTKASTVNSRERRERSKKPTAIAETQDAKISKLSLERTETKIIRNGHNSVALTDTRDSETSLINQQKQLHLNSDNLHNLLLFEQQSTEELQIRSETIVNNEMNSNSSRRHKMKQSSTENTNKAENLHIEDVALTENGLKSTNKCDVEAQEFQRASKEINRSNRRIIKQTFVSDVLEIPEKIENSIEYYKESIQRNSNNIPVSTPNRPAIDSTTEEEEEDDWETMYDDSGECLDPKIMQELTASVGKVKIELPKMDYSAYLTKQSILNDEEFPHVLEVSNFPVEFKNHDLLMVFSQYKESGFDIKWVDDTHALAVFSSSRIAAEVLSMGHPFVVLKPLAEATIESRLKAKKCAASLQPYRQRPETCAALARRLVTGALGVRLKTAAAERENEKRVLREAKERKMLAAKQRDEIWES